MLKDKKIFERKLYEVMRITIYLSLQNKRKGVVAILRACGESTSTPRYLSAGNRGASFLNEAGNSLRKQGVVHCITINTQKRKVKP